MKRCIWCKKLNNSKALEHIIPEALGCPEEFIFKDGTVCEQCNNKLAHVDRAVVDEYDLVLFTAGVPRKRGRKPIVRSRGNFIADYDKDGHKFMALNMTRDSIDGPDGSKIAGFKNSDRNITGSLRPQGPEQKTSFSIQIGKAKKFRRGIVKIAYSSIAYFLGGGSVTAPEFDGIRKFVVSGYGDRPLLLSANTDPEFRHHVWPPYVRDGYYAVTFRLGPIEYVVDLSPDVRFFEELREKKKELSPSDEWTYLPIDA